jgi:hypothetical protein
LRSPRKSNGAIARAASRADAFLAANLPRLVRIALLLQVCGFAFVIAGTHGAFGPQKPNTTDFASFYAAGRLADLGRAGQAYDSAAHVAMERAIIGPGVIEQRFLNPPPFLLLCAPLAHLPYLAAFIVFEALTAGLWLLLATRIAAGGVSTFAAGGASTLPAGGVSTFPAGGVSQFAGGGALAAACLASVPAVWWALGWGQNSFVSAGLMATGTLLLRNRPLLAGAAFGALCFKPNFGLLIPVALLAGRHWRAIFGAALSVAGLGLLSLACFGWAAWAGFLAMAAHARAAIETGIQLSGHADLAGAARLAGVPPGWSWALQAVASVLAAACVAWAWSGQRAAAARVDPAAAAAANAVLVAGTLTAMPFVLFYDLVMAGLAGAWLARAARLRGWRPGEPAWLAIAWTLSLLAFAAAALLHLAVAVGAAPILLWLSARRLRTLAVSKN